MVKLHLGHHNLGRVQGSGHTPNPPFPAQLLVSVQTVQAALILGALWPNVEPHQEETLPN